MDTDSNNYGVIIKIYGNADSLNGRLAEVFLEKYGRYRSIVLAFESSTYGICYINWKAADRNEFLFVQVTKEQDGQESATYDLVLNSVKNQHSGCKEEIPGYLCYHRDYNLLMSTVESKNSGAISSLIKSEFNLNDEIKGKTAADITWNCGQLNMLLQLPRNNSVYPMGFNPRFLPDDEHKNLVTITEEIHQHLHARNKQKIVNNLNADPSLRTLHNFSNTSPDIENRTKVKFERPQRKPRRLNICLGVGLVLVLLAAVQPVYSWHNLTDEARVSVENSTINFQGHNVTFEELLGNNSKALSLLSSYQINSLIQNNYLNVGEEFRSNVEFYVERFFHRTYFWMNELNFENITQILEEYKIIILSDKAGSGKTTTHKKLVEKLKDRFKLKWVSYFDLKKYFNVYESKVQIKNWDKEKLVNFIGKELLRLNESVEFAVFEERFNSDNVILLWDGVDEISPHSRDFITDLFLNIKEFSNNTQWISTRPQYKDVLREKLNQRFFYSLQPFSKEERVDFLIKFFAFHNLSADEIEQKIQLFSDRIKIFDRDDDDLNNPLIVRMFGEMLLDSNYSMQLENKYLLYKEFVNKAILIASGKDKVVTGDLQKSAKVSKIYEHFALKLLFEELENVPDLAILKMKVDVSNEISPNEILLGVSHRNIDFIHRTFAEFLVAQYLIDNVLQPEDTPRDEEIQARMKLLFIIAERTVMFQVTRYFLNDFLSINSTHKCDARFSAKAAMEINSLIDAYWKEDCFLLYRFDESFKMFDFIATIMRGDEQFLKILWHLDKHENFFIYLTKPSDEARSYEYFLSIARKHLPREFTDEKVKEMSVDHAGNILFNYWYFYDDVKDKPSPYEGIIKLLPEDLRNSMNFMKFLTKMKQNLTKNQFKLMIQSNMYRMLERVKAQDIAEFVKAVNKTLSRQEITQSFEPTCQNKFHLILEFMTEDYVENLVNSFDQYFDKTAIETFLSEGSFLESSAMNINGKVLKKVGDFALKHLKSEDIDTLLSNKEIVATAIYRSSIATCESLANFLKELYAGNEGGLRKLLYEKSVYERTIFDEYNSGVYKLRREPFRILAREFPFHVPPEVLAFDPTLTFNSSNFYSPLEKFVELKLENSSELMQAHMHYTLKIDGEFKVIVNLSPNLTRSDMNGPEILWVSYLLDAHFPYQLYRDFFLAKILIDRLYNAGSYTSKREIESLFHMFNHITWSNEYPNVITLMLNYIDSDTTQVKSFPPLIRDKVKNDTSEIIFRNSCDLLLLKIFSKDEELLHLLLVQSLIAKDHYDDLYCIKPVYDTVNVQKILQNQEFKMKILGRLKKIRKGKEDINDLNIRHFKSLFPEIIEALKTEL